MTLLAFQKRPALRHRRPTRYARRAACFPAMLLLLALVPAGCGRMQGSAPPADDGYSVAMVSEPSPPVVGPGMLTFTLRDPGGAPVVGAGLKVIGNMSHAGMIPVTGAPESSTADEYRVSMDWTMSGDWFVDVNFSVPDGTEVSRRFPISVR